jgi:hypothetical protein
MPWCATRREVRRIQSHHGHHCTFLRKVHRLRCAHPNHTEQDSLHVHNPGLNVGLIGVDGRCANGWPYGCFCCAWAMQVTDFVRKLRGLLHLGERHAGMGGDGPVRALAPTRVGLRLILDRTRTSLGGKHSTSCKSMGVELAWKAAHLAACRCGSSPVSARPIAIR